MTQPHSLTPKCECAPGLTTHERGGVTCCDMCGRPVGASFVPELVERVALAIMAEQQPPHPLRLMTQPTRDRWIRMARAAIAAIECDATDKGDAPDEITRLREQIVALREALTTIANGTSRNPRETACDTLAKECGETL